MGPRSHRQGHRAPSRGPEGHTRAAGSGLQRAAPDPPQAWRPTPLRSPGQLCPAGRQTCPRSRGRSPPGSSAWTASPGTRGRQPTGQDTERRVRGRPVPPALGAAAPQRPRGSRAGALLPGTRRATAGLSATLLPQPRAPGSRRGPWPGAALTWLGVQHEPGGRGPSRSREPAARSATPEARLQGRPGSSSAAEARRVHATRPGATATPPTLLKA